MFSGNKNMPVVSKIVAENCGVAGNMLGNGSVIEACHEGYLNGLVSLPRRLSKGLQMGAKEGGDFRGLQSGAIVIILLNAPPVDLRVEFGESPLMD